MTRTEYLLDVLAEESVEVAKEVSKALRFGLTEKMAGPPYNSVVTNAQRIADELGDVLGMVDWLVEEGLLPPPSEMQRRTKRQRVESYMRYSQVVGALVLDPVERP